MFFKKKAPIECCGLDVFRGGQLERLEDRLLMAVNISQVGANLTITGSADDEVIHVQDDGEGVRVSADEDGDGTSDFYEVYYGVNNITINTGNGDDLVAASDLTLNGNLTINTGAGDDFVYVSYDLNVNDIGIDVSAGDNTIYGNVSVNAGAGDDRVFMESSAIGGNVGIVGGNGSDRVRMGRVDISNFNQSMFVGGDVAIDTGAGPDIVSFVAPQSAYFEIDGDLTIKAGTNYDVVSMISDEGSIGMEVNGETTIDLGAGDDRFGVVGEFAFNDVFTLKAGDGNDGVAFAGDVDFGGATSFDLGKGNDVWSASGYSNGAVDFYGDVSLLGGAHNDRVVFGDEADNSGYTVFHASATFDGGAGLNRLEVHDFPAVYGEFPVFKKFVVFQQS